MQVVEKPVEGLSRSYGVTVPAAELGAALDVRIAEILPTLKLKGFRPGKVPQAHVRRLYGKALMSEVVEKTLNDTSQQVLNDSQLRIASRPDLIGHRAGEALLIGALHRLRAAGHRTIEVLWVGPMVPYARLGGRVGRIFFVYRRRF